MLVSNINDTIAQYRRALELSEDPSGVLDQLGEALHAELERHSDFSVYLQALEPNQDDADFWVQIGNSFVQQQQLSSALIAYRLALVLQPNLGQSPLALLLNRLQADPVYGNAYSDTHSDLARTLYESAKRFVHLQRWQTAADYFEQAAMLAPEWIEVYVEWRDVLVKLEQWPPLLACSLHLTELQPQSWWWHYQVGHVQVHLEQWADAVLSFQRAIALNPEIDEIYYHMGQSLVALERWSEALHSLQTAVALNPQSRPTQELLVEVLMRLSQDNDQADTNQGFQAQVAQTQVPMDVADESTGTAPPDSSAVRIPLEEASIVAVSSAPPVATPSNALNPSALNIDRPTVRPSVRSPQVDSQRENQVGLTRTRVNPTGSGLVKRSSEQAIALLGKGDRCRQLNQWDEALILYRQALALDPLLYQAHHGIGEAMVQQDDLEAAAQSYQQALTINPDYFWSHHCLSQVLLWQGKAKDAVASAQQAIELEPENALFYQQLGRSLHKNEDFEEAIEAYRQALTLQPDNWELLYALGRSLDRLNTDEAFEEAIETYRLALTLEQDSWELLYALGKTLAHAGRWDESVAVYHQLLLLHPDSSDSDDYTVHIVGIIRFGCEWVQRGLAAVVSNQLLAELEIHPPRLCSNGEDFLFPPELLLLQTLSYLEGTAPSAAQISKLDAYYRRINPSLLQKQIYPDVIQPFLVWAHNQIFCYSHVSQETLATNTRTNLQHLIVVLSRIAIDQYGDLHLALNLVNCGLAFEDDLALLRLAVRINAGLGRHYEAFSTAQKCLLHQVPDADVYFLAATSAMEVVQKSLPLLLSSMEQVLTWALTAFKLNPASSRSRYLLDRLLSRFAHQAINSTVEMGMRNQLQTALALRYQAFQYLNQAVAQQTQLMRTASGTPSDMLPVRPRFGNILLAGTKELSQCYYYRIQQKLAHLDLCGVEASFIAVSELGGLQWQKQLMEIDVVIVCRLPATFEVLRFVYYARSIGIPVLYDIDDFIFDEAHFPAPFESYSKTIDRRTHTYLTLDNPLFQSILPACDGIIVSTGPLAEQVRRFVTHETPVWIYPNLMGDELATLSSLGLIDNRAYQTDNLAESAKPIRIFYGSGTKAHKQAFYEVLVPALAQILERYEQVEVCLVGYFELPTELEAFKHRISIESFVSDYSAYLYLLYDADINLAVLEDSIATDCKSEIKWLEAAAFGIPSVVSPTGTYQHLLQPGQDVLFAANTEEWANALSQLIEDTDLRSQLGQSAYQKGITDYTADAGRRYMMQVLEHHLPTGKKHNRKRLLVVNVYFAPQSVGGATRVAENQVRYLLDHHSDEYEVYILCAEIDPSIRAPYEVEQYAFGAALVTKLYVPGRDWADHRDDQVLEFCREFYQTHDFDLIHFHCIQVLTAAVVDAAQMLRIPYVITAHDAWWLTRYQFLVDEEGGLVDPRDSRIGSLADSKSLKLEQQRQQHVTMWKAELERRNHLMHCLRKASVLLAVSESFAEIYRTVGLTNVLVNENGVEPFEVLPKLLSASGRVRIAHVGGVSRHKGFHLFREALEQGEFHNLEAIVIDHSLEPGEVFEEVWGTTPVTFRSKVKQAEIGQLYREIDVLVAPSIWPESYGLVTREAMYAGVWVIASDRGAIGADVIEGENGNLIDVANCDDLVKVLSRINDKPEIYSQPHVSNQIKGFRSSLDQLGELTKVYQSILRSNVISN